MRVVQHLEMFLVDTDLILGCVSGTQARLLMEEFRAV